MKRSTLLSVCFLASSALVAISFAKFTKFQNTIKPRIILDQPLTINDFKVNNDPNYWIKVQGKGQIQQMLLSSSCAKEYKQWYSCIEHCLENNYEYNNSCQVIGDELYMVCLYDEHYAVKEEFKPVVKLLDNLGKPKT